MGHSTYIRKSPHYKACLIETNAATSRICLARAHHPWSNADCELPTSAALKLDPARSVEGTLEMFLPPLSLHLAPPLLSFAYNSLPSVFHLPDVALALGQARQCTLGLRQHSIRKKLVELFGKDDHLTLTPSDSTNTHANVQLKGTFDSTPRIRAGQAQMNKSAPALPVYVGCIDSPYT